ncbi:hypothetical protein D3C86_1840350 [compost metagenome]
MRGQHVVVRGDNRNIVTEHAFQRRFIFWLTGSKPVGQITAGQLGAMYRVGFGLLDAGEIGRTCLFRAFDNTLRYP